jgi:hypothetical protein
MFRWLAYIPLAAFICSRASLAADAVVTIDATAILKQNFNIPTQRVRYLDECSPMSTCRGPGFCSKIPPCEFYDVIENITVEKLSRLSLGDPVALDLDNSMETQSITVNNCRPVAWSTDREETYHTNEYLEYSNSAVYTNVSNDKFNFEINASLFKVIGGKYGESIEETVTYSLTQKSDFHKDVSVDVKVPLKFETPPGKKDIISFVDKKKSITVPLTIDAVLRADVYQQIRWLNGTVAREDKIRTLADTDEDKRTIHATGSLYYKASDHSIEISPTQVDAICNK